MTESKGDELFKKAGETMEKRSWYFFGPDKEEKADAGIKLYLQSATQYKIEHLYEKAGMAYTKAGELYEMQSHGFNNAGDAYVDAGDMFKIGLSSSAKLSYDKAIKIFVENNKLDKAARALKSKAGVMEADGELLDAMCVYEKAIDYLKMENWDHQAATCTDKVVVLAISFKGYAKALEKLEELVIYYNKKENPYKTSTYIFEAIVVQLYLGDIKLCKSLLDMFCGIKKDFVSTPEYDLIEKMFSAYPNADKFADVVCGRKVRIRPWVGELLLDIQTRLDNKIMINNDLEDEDDFT